jgi:hypothetical protein
MVQANLTKKQDLSPRQPDQKRAEGMVQTGEYLPSKYKILSSNHNIAKRINKKWIKDLNIKI